MCPGAANLRCLRQCDATNCDDWFVNGTTNHGQSLYPEDRIRILFRAGWENRTDAHVVHRQLVCFESLLQIVCGKANETIWAQYFTRRERRKIRLTQMHTGCPRKQRHIDTIVDDDARISRRERKNALQLLQQLPGRGLLIAELQETDAAGKQLLSQCDRIPH